jgi:phosphoribosyl-ATP pyrophosphohydrolase
MTDNKIISFEDLYDIVLDRIKRLPEKSYVADLVRSGNNRVIQKVGEEAVELIVAVKGRSRKRIVEEIADLYFHTLILLAVKKITLRDVYRELYKRRRKVKNTS